MSRATHRTEGKARGVGEEINREVHCYRGRCCVRFARENQKSGRRRKRTELQEKHEAQTGTSAKCMCVTAERGAGSRPTFVGDAKRGSTVQVLTEQYKKNRRRNKFTHWWGETDLNSHTVTRTQVHTPNVADKKNSGLAPRARTPPAAQKVNSRGASRVTTNIANTCTGFQEKTTLPHAHTTHARHSSRRSSRTKGGTKLCPATAEKRLEKTQKKNEGRRTLCRRGDSENKI